MIHTIEMYRLTKEELDRRACQARRRAEIGGGRSELGARARRLFGRR